MRTITNKAKLETEKTTGARPELILQIDWGRAIGTRYYGKSTKTLGTIPVEGRVTQWGSITSQKTSDSVATVGTFTVGLDDTFDTDDALRVYINSHSLINIPCTVWVHFTNLDASNMFKMCAGKVEGPIVWSDENRQYDLQITTQASEFTIGWKDRNTDGVIYDEKNDDPICFGAPRWVKCSEAENLQETITTAPFHLNYNGCDPVLHVYDSSTFPQNTPMSLMLEHQSSMVSGPLKSVVFGKFVGNTFYVTGPPNMSHNVSFSFAKRRRTVQYNQPGYAWLKLNQATGKCVKCGGQASDSVHVMPAFDAREKEGGNHTYTEAYTKIVSADLVGRVLAIGGQRKLFAYCSDQSGELIQVRYFKECDPNTGVYTFKDFTGYAFDVIVGSGTPAAGSQVVGPTSTPPETTNGKTYRGWVLNQDQLKYKNKFSLNIAINEEQLAHFKLAFGFMSNNPNVIHIQEGGISVTVWYGSDQHIGVVNLLNGLTADGYDNRADLSKKIVGQDDPGCPEPEDESEDLWNGPDEGDSLAALNFVPPPSATSQTDYSGWVLGGVSTCPSAETTEVETTGVQYGGKTIIPVGSRVVRPLGTMRQFIANLYPSVEVTGVYAAKTDTQIAVDNLTNPSGALDQYILPIVAVSKDGRVLKRIPPSYYTVELAKTIRSNQVTLITVDGLDDTWEYPIYVNLLSSLPMNAARVIEKIITEFMPGYTADSDSFGCAAAQINDMPVNFVLYGEQDARKLIEDIAFQARCALKYDGDLIKIRFLGAKP